MVPAVTVYFWIIKVLATTVGETAADFLGTHLNLGLTGTSLVLSGMLAVTLCFQFRADRYLAPLYWLAVVLISIVGTLVSDNLTDNLGVSLRTTTVLFGVALAATFAAWYVSERTLSIHTICTSRRQGWYWLTILFTFALGTSAGDLVAEQFSLGYLVSVFLFAGLIAATAVTYALFRFNGVLAFWIAYVLTRPLGASVGDLLSQPRDSGGLGLGTTLTSACFLAVILALVAFLARTRLDTERS
jgi:uncharacterized membrane-anchored protein